jgi:hypothetical protein
MSKENKPEDLESTVRLDMRKIASPYDDSTPPSVDSIEDILIVRNFLVSLTSHTTSLKKLFYPQKKVLTSMISPKK